MIVVDTSALIAILFNEPDADYFDRALFAANQISIAAPTALEFLVVAERRRGFVVREQANALLEANNLLIVAWTATHLRIAEQAYLQFGKGRHPAQLNFGDCMTYALAKSLDVPLLYKGDDFSKTDIVSAV